MKEEKRGGEMKEEKRGGGNEGRKKGGEMKEEKRGGGENEGRKKFFFNFNSDTESKLKQKTAYPILHLDTKCRTCSVNG